MIKEKDTTLTPISLIEKLGNFDIDPCGISYRKTANKIIELPNNGLLEEWSGRVWLNPPYSNPKPFLEKLANHKNGIALVLKSTDSVWFQEYGLKRVDGIFFLKGRLKIS